MAQKSRVQLTEIVEQNIYDNTQKEILAENVREVLLDYRDSHYNLIDDELRTVKYNSTQTLEQYLNTIAGSVPVYGRILNFDVGLGSGVDLVIDNNPPGIISSASTKGYPYITNNSLIEINFNIDIGNKRLIPVLTTNSENWDYQNDICTPTIRRITTEQIHLGLRQIVPGIPQSLNIEIIAI